jgi:hypothetical protein
MPVLRWLGGSGGDRLRFKVILMFAWLVAFRTRQEYRQYAVSNSALTPSASICAGNDSVRSNSPETRSHHD